MHRNTNRVARGLMLGAACIAFQAPGCTVDQAMLQQLLDSLVANGGSVSFQLDVDNGSGSVSGMGDGMDDSMDDSMDDGMDDGMDDEMDPL